MQTSTHFNAPAAVGALGDIDERQNLLESRSGEEAVDLLTKVRRASARSFTIVDDEGIVCCEFTPNEFRSWRTKDLTRANHFLHPELAHCEHLNISSSSEKEAMIVQDLDHPAPDNSLQELLTRVYVGGGYTDAGVAERAFTPATVRARGSLYWAPDYRGDVAGTVILVPPSSSASRFATPGEGELHLLAVDPALRGRGVGKALVDAVVAEAKIQKYKQLSLWTQPTMHAAHRVYLQAGFVPASKRDFQRDGRQFRVMLLELEAQPSGP